MKVFVGNKIEFTEDVIDYETSEHPAFVMAKKGERGLVITKSLWNEKEWFVQPKGRNPFYAMESEFKVIED